MRWRGPLILALGIGFLYAAKSVLFPFLIAFLLAYAFDPVIGFLEERKVRRSWAIWFIFLIIVAAIFLVLFFVIPVIQGEIARAAEKFPAYLEDIRERVIPYFEEKTGFRFPKTFQEILATILPRLQQEAPHIFRPVTAFVLAFFSNTARFLLAIVNLIVIPVAFYYFSKDFNRLKATVARYIPPKYEGQVYRRLREVDRSLSGFIRGQLLVIFFLAVPGAAVLVVLIKALAEYYRSSTLFQRRVG